MRHISTSRTLAVLITVFVHLRLCYSQGTSTQTTLDRAAADLDIKLAVETNHLTGESYKIVFQLRNNGRSPILVEDDWSVLFSMRDGNNLTRPEFLVHGLSIKSGEGCFFVISKKPGANPRFPGLQPGQAFKITIEKRGLSVFKYDIDNNFIITAPGLTPRTVASTQDADLGFVYLAAANKSDDDFSTMNAFRRSIIAADIADMGRLGRDMIIPKTKNISDVIPGQLIDFQDADKVFVWMDSSLSAEFKDYVKTELLKINGIDAQKLQFVNAVPSGPGHRFYIQINTKKPQTKDGYTLATVREGGQRQENFTHLSARTEEGLSNGFETFKSMVGEYSVLPAVTVDDDADMGIRSLKLDVTKHFFGPETIKKLLRLMKMYKMNTLVLTLGSDDAMRIPLRNAADFPEIVSYASKRCADQDKCLPPLYGSGAEETPSSSGHFTHQEFIELLRYAKQLKIDIIPQVNVIGSLRSAKKASHKRYERLAATNPTEADRLHMMTSEPKISANEAPADSCYADGIIDPCDSATRNFISELLTTLKELYTSAGVPFTTFHAGGDPSVKFFGAFPSCQAAGKSQSDAQRDLLGEVQQFMNQVGGKVQANEEAVIDPATGTCLSPSVTSPSFEPTNLQAEFRKTAPNDPNSWDLSAAQMAYLTSEVKPFDPANPQAVPDVLRTFNGTKKGLAPWGKAYDCANSGYKTILSPENFLALDSSYELDFNEIGNWRSDGFFIVNLYRMIMFEPYNLYINTDIGSTGAEFLPNRLCQIFECPPLANKDNVAGLQASVDTRVIRTEEQLWRSLLPRLLLAAQKMWRRGPYEDLLRAEDPNSLTKMEADERRTGLRRIELMEFSNNLGYKELGRLDAAGYTYRIPKVEAHTRNGIAMGLPPPFPLISKTDVPGIEIEYKDLNSSSNPWKPLFEIDQRTGMLTGGYLFDFPDQSQRLLLRSKSADGKRTSDATLYTGETKNLMPQEIPPELRGGACLRITEPWLTDLSKVTEPQWRRVISNIFTVGQEENEFRMRRQNNLTATMAAYNRQYNQQYNINQILAAIVQSAQTGQNVSLLPLSNPIRQIYDVDAALHQERAEFIRNRLDQWQQTYLRCQAGQSQVQPPAPMPRGMMPGAPGFGPGTGTQVGGPMNPGVGPDGQGAPGQMGGAAGGMTGGRPGTVPAGRGAAISGARTGGGAMTQGRGQGRGARRTV